ncbi:hypothetical protein PYW08_011412 [Mythimna loreyi]|uniref:Uncharacterized protein n=1 Tax=Mythimna loreyi TaxID=667449 RepID=A0ACC2Q8C3_9NEOP|nr:hypothetical protein PYW08_011412 [Mythimna loreyi]
MQADAVSDDTAGLSKRTKSTVLEEENVTKVDDTPELSKRTEALARENTALSDIEDVVTMLDKQDDLEDAVTLSAIESEFFTSVTIRENVRRALSATRSPTTTSPTTKATTKASSRTTTTAPTTTTVASTSQPGSLVYDLKRLKTTTTSKPSHKEKNSSGFDRERHRRLFKISSLLQNRFKSMMKNLTANTKHSTTATVLNVTALTSKYISRRTCILSTESLCVPVNVSVAASRSSAETTLEENADENEGFKVTFIPEYTISPDGQRESGTRLPPGRQQAQSSGHYPLEAPPHGTVHHHYHHYTTPHDAEDQGSREEYSPPPTYPHHTVPSEPQGGYGYEEPYTPAPEHRQHTSHRGKGKCKLPVHQEIQDTVVYREPDTYDDQLYYEHDALTMPPTPTVPTEHCDYKREVPLNTYTAKDVAALEVIVDLMKNTLNFEDSMPYRSHTLFEPFTSRPGNTNSSTNAIQVHIAIPFNFQNGKKRSPSALNPVRVRKVFCAKMSTPVDLEYQVHSFEGTIRPTSTRMSKSSNFTEDAFSPGMYLLIDNPKNGYGLKPILGQINLADLKSRQVAAGTTVSMSEAKPTENREETTSLKSLAKVTLSKDFVAAVNQQLIEMYENMSRVNKDVNRRPARSVWNSRKLNERKKGRKRSAEKYIVKRGIDWEAIKHFFGHDRVCNCKCKSNTAMCRACAASDAVIDELIFEFDNIGRYMADHCTEIQTFFWMNPIGGQKLRESVNKIDKSLTDYYKRVKGKCQGRLCNSFNKYFDKRRLTKTYKIKKEDSMSRLMNDLAVLAEDLNRTVSLKVCYNDKLKESGDKFIQLMNNCVMKKYSKRSTPTTTSTTKLVKSVYSLDNINVNIFCNPEPSPVDEQMFTVAITGVQENPQRMTDRLVDFDMEEVKESPPPKHKKRKGFKNLFPRKNKKSKLLSYFDFNKKSKANYKRQVDNQAATPLISDGGGAFWYDYLKAGTNEPRLVRNSVNDSPPNIEIAVVQKSETKKNAVTETPKTNLVSNTIYMTLVTNAERNQRDIETTTTDTLSQNINQMLQLFGSLQDIEAMNNNSSNRSVKSSKKVSNKEKSEKENKPKKPSLISKVKQKMSWSKNKTTTSSSNQKAGKSTLNKKLKELKNIEHEIESESKSSTSKHAVQNSKKDVLKETKSIIVNTTEPIKVNVTTFIPPSSITSTTTKAIYSSETANITNVVRTTTMALKKEEQSETTSIVTESTTNLGFINKLKAATKLYLKGDKFKTTEFKTETPTTTVNVTDLLLPLSSGVIDIVTDVNNKVMDYVIEETTQNASNEQNVTQNPTIVIINEYGNKVNSDTIGDKEEFKNLLLSIIQFETNSLNDEWERVAYAGDRSKNENDVKRSIVGKPHVATINPPVTLTATPNLQTVSMYEESLPDYDMSTTQQPEGILDKIVSKMGIKVIRNKKKVVKKASIRQVRKDRKNNIIRNRRLRINSYRSDTASPSREARDSRRPAKSNKICDLQATYEHLKKLQRTIPPKAFEMVAKNITCYRYRNADPIFVIPYKRKGKRWDWIRNKRSLKLHFYEKDENNFYDEPFTVNFEDDFNDSFERFAKGDDGIYKIVTRKKRAANLEALERGLRNIPNLTPGEDELYVMAGDTVTMDCGLHAPVRTCDGKFIWKTDRSRMLKQDNVYVDDVSLVIKNVEPKNVGTYTCSLDHTVRKNVKLNVLTIPAFDVVFLPVYKTQDNCSYDDLKAIQRLGSLMANEIRCGRSCAVRIDEPVCQKDKGTNSTLVRVAAVISVTPRALNCSLDCKRDIVSSLVMLCATNTAVLSSIKVLVSKDGVNETLTPWKNLVRPVVTHTLRKKDTNGHHEYHKLISLLAPGKVDVVLICPAGYYLLPKYKLCSSCPPNTSSKTGDNTCRSCPRGTRAEPGAAKCHLVQTHPRRYDWWWYPPCGYMVACCGVLFGCTTCVLLSLIVHVLSRDAELKEQESADREGQKTPQTMRRVTVAYAHVPGTRPLSPSRVILPRFFRPSPASSRATDSQETKFELWKEKNIPPPLPPIDFDP